MWKMWDEIVEFFMQFFRHDYSSFELLLFFQEGWEKFTAIVFVYVFLFIALHDAAKAHLYRLKVM